MFDELKWTIYKKTIMKKVINELNKISTERILKFDCVIYIIENLLIKNSSAIQKSYNIVFNPLNPHFAIIFILENYKVLNDFPEEKRLIKKILK